VIIRLLNTQTVFQFENDFKHKDDWKTKNDPLTHAYVLWAANELLAVFAPAFPLSL
jgi:hypothetical protein